MSYIDAKKVYEHLEQVGDLYPRFADNIVDNAVSNVINDIKNFISSLQQEPRFPQENNIVEKVFGAGNIEGFEYREAEMLVTLAKEELLKSLQQEQPNAYDVAMLEVKKYVDKLYDNASIGLNEYDSGLYNGITETCMKLRGFIKARTSKDQPEVDFETEYAKFSNNPDALDYAFPIDLADYKDFARHFYELGLKARKK